MKSGFVSVVVAALCSTGCVGMSHGQRARTLGKDVTQRSAGVAAQAAVRLDGVLSGLGVRAEAAARRGFSDTFDGSLRAGLVMRCDFDECPTGFGFGDFDVELQGKWALTRQDSAWVTSFAPAIGIALLRMPAALGMEGGNDLVGMPHLRLPLLIGYLYPGGSELVVAPEVYAVGVMPGISVGLSYLSRHDQLLLGPEVVVGITLNGQVHGQVGITVAFGDSKHVK